MFLRCWVSMPTRLSSYGPNATSAALTANIAAPVINAARADRSRRRYATPNMPGISHIDRLR